MFRLLTTTILIVTLFVIINPTSAQISVPKAFADASTKVVPSLKDTQILILAYKMLGKKPLAVTYNGDRYRLVCVLHSPSLLKFWGISEDLKGIFFTATSDNNNNPLFTPTPMNEWEEFLWLEDTDNVLFIQSLMKNENFDYQRVMFDAWGAQAELTIMVRKTDVSDNNPNK